MIGFLIWLQQPCWSFPVYGSRLDVSGLLNEDIKDCQNFRHFTAFNI